MLIKAVGVGKYDLVRFTWSVNLHRKSPISHSKFSEIDSFIEISVNRR